MATDGKAKCFARERVMPTHPHLRCVQACCCRTRGLDGSAVLRVDLLLLSDEGWFWGGRNRPRVNSLDWYFYFAITHIPQKFPFQGKCCVYSSKGGFRWHVQVKWRHWTDGVQCVGTSECFTSDSFLPHQFWFQRFLRSYISRSTTNHQPPIISK